MADRLHPKKSLGQHFLVDSRAAQRIVEQVPEGARVLEIGPGAGALTKLLLPRAEALVVIEKDDDWASFWQSEAQQRANLIVEHGDACKLLAPLVAQHRIEWIVGNLPYNISGPITAAIVPLDLEGVTFMYQLEVAQRLCAQPGARHWGRISALVRWRWQPRLLFRLPPAAFRPAPKVHSAVVRFEPRRPLSVSFSIYAQMLAIGFRHPRKTLANNLRGRLSQEEIAQLGIEPSLRPAQLAPEDWLRLARAWAEKTAARRRPLCDAAGADQTE